VSNLNQSNVQHGALLQKPCTEIVPRAPRGPGHSFSFGHEEPPAIPRAPTFPQKSTRAGVLPQDELIKVKRKSLYPCVEGIVEFLLTGNHWEGVSCRKIPSYNFLSENMGIKKTEQKDASQSMPWIWLVSFSSIMPGNKCSLSLFFLCVCVCVCVCVRLISFWIRPCSVFCRRYLLELLRLLSQDYIAIWHTQGQRSGCAGAHRLPTKKREQQCTAGLVNKVSMFKKRSPFQKD